MKNDENISTNADDSQAEDKFLSSLEEAEGYKFAIENGLLLDHVIEKVRKVISHCLYNIDAEEININAVLADLDIDSLLAVEIVMDLEEVFDKDDLENTLEININETTVLDLSNMVYDVVKKDIEQKYHLNKVEEPQT